MAFVEAKPVTPRVHDDFRPLIDVVFHPIEDDSILNTSLEAVIWRTGPASTKATLAESVLAHMGWEGRFATAQSHHVPEAEFNNNADSSLIAAAKVVQTSRDDKTMIQSLIGETRSNPEHHNVILMGSSDVVVHLPKKGSSGAKEACNKPEVTNKEELFQLIKSRVGVEIGEEVSSYGVLPEAKMVVGEALYDPRRKKGVTYEEKMFFRFQPLNDIELWLYVFGYNGAMEKARSVYGEEVGEPLVISLWKELIEEGMSSEDIDTLLDDGAQLSHLTSVNSGIRWESPLFRRKITQIGGVSKDDENFSIEMAKLVLGLRGVAGVRPRAIHQAVKFCMSSRRPKKNGIQKFLNQSLLKKMGDRDFGSWIKLSLS